MSINRILDRDVQEIKRELDNIILETKVQYKDTYKALELENYKLAKEVIVNHKRIIAMQDNFINMALWKITKQGFVASDLRLAIGSILIVREITKIAEYARTISHYLIDFKPSSLNYEQLKVTFKLLFEMLDMIQILVDHYDVDLSTKVVKIERDINRDFLNAKRDMITNIRAAKTDETAMLLYSSLRQIKNLEKAGDRIINIQEILNFIRTGVFEEMENKIDNSF